MNILFLTIYDFSSLEEYHIYTDLLRQFRNDGHNIYSISPIEKRNGKNTHTIEEKNSIILKLKTGNMQKTNSIEKAISTVMIERIFTYGIKKYFSDVRFDLVLYSTPPVTFYKAVKYVKNRDNCKTYLLLKDIFPQNSVDLGMLSKSGIKGILYKYFRKKEKNLYRVSDRIGCMSPANVNYILRENPEINPEIVEVSPNSIEVIDKSIDNKERIRLRKKYRLPLHKIIFVYGGNLGKPQGIDFLIQCIYSQKDNDHVYFLIIGDGTEFYKLHQFYEKYGISNFSLLNRLAKEDYDNIVAACDVGMIFLDHRFTIPNFPSRILDYMAAKLPVLACTDPNTDIGQVIMDGNFGWWCESNNIFVFEKTIRQSLNCDLIDMGKKSFIYLAKYWSAQNQYREIMKAIKYL